ncbi:MAG: vWA domain-containing protein [Planctomycetaceae bacterium]
MTNPVIDYFPVDPPGTPSNWPPLIAAAAVVLLLLLPLSISTTGPEPPPEIGHRIGDHVDRIIFFHDSESSTAGVTASAISAARPQTAAVLPVEIAAILPSVESFTEQPAMPPAPELQDSAKELDELRKDLKERRAMAEKLAGSHGLADAFKEARNDARVAIFVLDFSGSMEGSPFREMSRALMTALSDIEDDQLAAVVLYNDSFLSWDGSSFAGAVEPRLISKQEIGALEQALALIEPSGGTNPWPALEVAASALQPHQGTGALVVLSDGWFDGTTPPNDRPLQAFRKLCNGLHVAVVAPIGADSSTLSAIAGSNVRIGP